jgi:hypothetical protein
MKSVPCLGIPPDWPDTHEQATTVSWAGIEECVPGEADGLDAGDMDDSDLEDLIVPEPPVPLISEISRLADKEDENSAAVDSNMDVDIY